MLHKNSFLAIAEDLKVKGLTQSKSEEVRRQQHALTTPRPRDPPKDSHEPIPQPKRSRPVAFTDSVHRVNTIQNSYQAVDDDIQEVAPIKTEKVSVPEKPHRIQIHTITRGWTPTWTTPWGCMRRTYADYENYEECT